MDLITLFFFYFILVFSIIGFGKFVCIHTKLKFDIGFQGLLGILFLIIVSYFSNYFFPHNYFHNSIIILIGFSYFIYLAFLKKIVFRDIKIVFIVFSILFIGLLMYKNHDDFITYHFPYTLSLINYKKIIGIGHLDGGFTTPSSIFYLNSLFYLPFVEYYLTNSGAVYIMGFSNLFLLNVIQFNLKKKNFILYLSGFSFVFINTVFYRIAEHGTDRSALILVFLLSIIFLESINIKKSILKDNLYNYYIKLIILITLIISLKSFYLIYILIFFVWIFYLKDFLFKKEIIFNFLNNRFFYLCISGFMLSILTVFFNTGCLIFPASFTCFENVQWSFNLDTVKAYKLWFEQWSKAGASPNFRIENPEVYLSNFNWLDGWIERYFFTKVTDFLFLTFLIITIFYFLFSFQKKVKILKKKIKYKLFYLFIFLFCLEWFLNHPALRYGGYTILALLAFIPMSIYLSNFNHAFKVFSKKFQFIILLSIIIFVSKNAIRINSENLKYGYEVFNKPYFYLNKSAFRTDIQIKEILNQNNNLSSKGYLIIKNN